MLRFTLCFLVLCFVLSAHAQFTYSLDQSIPVTVNDQTLPLAWSGGVNSAQISTMDLNGDAKQDLVIFDRAANKILTFLNQNNQYVYSPDYESLFPSIIDQWVLLRDFNCDGKKDLFTSDPFGIRAFINTTKPGGQLSWRPFNPDFPLLTVGFNGQINLKVNQSDIPAIEDMDGDGDLDIMNIRFVGIGSAEYHQNMSMENTGRCDSMQLVRTTQTWGSFQECNCGVYAYGITCDQLLFGARTEHAGGKTMLTMDFDNNGIRDILFSEETCDDIYLLLNTGTKDTPLITGYSIFPTNHPVNFSIFPAPYYEDIDFDGVSDLVVAPNTYARVNFADDLKNSMWLYKNTGTTLVPQFQYIKSNFLQDQMIDVGDNSVPAFIDADGDGDNDLFVSTYVQNDSSGSVYYYQNTGTASQPQFKFVTDDYLNLSSLNLYNLKIQFADINNDNKPDLLFTGTDNIQKTTGLYYIANTVQHGLDLGDNPVPVPANFTIQQSENVLLVDVDQDGLNDILLGNATGALQYWRNTGSGSTPIFTLNNNAFLGLSTSTDRQNLTIAQGDLDGDGRADLIVGNQLGNLLIYGDFRAQNTNLSGASEIVFNHITEVYEEKNLGGHVWPVVSNLFNSKPAIISGNTLGGLMILKNDGGSQLTGDPDISLYPNPVVKNGTLYIKSDRNLIAQLFTVLGQTLSDGYFVPANQTYALSLGELAAGMYIVRFTVNGKNYAQKFVIH
jgi:hypothetical protein